MTQHNIKTIYEKEHKNVQYNDTIHTYKPNKYQNNYQRQ
jgi:hypothetical protein